MKLYVNPDLIADLTEKSPMMQYVLSLVEEDNSIDGDKMAEAAANYFVVPSAISEVCYEIVDSDDYDHLHKFAMYVFENMKIKDISDLSTYRMFPIDIIHDDLNVVKTAMFEQISQYGLLVEDDSPVWIGQMNNWKFNGEKITIDLLETTTDKIDWLIRLGSGKERKAFYESFGGDKKELVPLLAYSTFLIEDKEMHDVVYEYLLNATNKNFVNFKNVSKELNTPKEDDIVFDVTDSTILNLIKYLGKVDLPRFIVTEHPELVTRALSSMTGAPIKKLDVNSVYKDSDWKDQGLQYSVLRLNNTRWPLMKSAKHEVQIDEINPLFVVSTTTPPGVKEEDFIKIKIGLNEIVFGKNVHFSFGVYFSPDWKIIYNETNS